MRQCEEDAGRGILYNNRENQEKRVLIYFEVIYMFIYTKTGFFYMLSTSC